MSLDIVLDSNDDPVFIGSPEEIRDALGLANDISALSVVRVPVGNAVDAVTYLGAR